ncbi:HMG box family protein [Trichomonas vaginalis G3]|uniref:HMG box family protein n=1 Tax=Trichomonas vaginalis (strain ATCC PRA-98 / G3) TaxID=412133 RepID=A2FD11_TRIV3|nr:HMG-box family [Trichomonas vaginalis G3]EAX97204.1 HMG box family protein [Trichomonas vaginalis G3]KAI5536193.1 HMG-box family [Trichomonas vaginalis G3]|eukprot:XP_001310134.1 HMG box family protein [Trichomonas vaginalis G3]
MDLLMELRIKFNVKIIMDFELLPQTFLTMTKNTVILSIPPSMAGKNKDKDGNKSNKMPKLPNPYFMFCKERRQILQAENSQISSREITKKLAEEWKNLPEIEKSRYNERYREELAKFYKEKEKLEHPQPMQNTLFLKLLSVDGRIINIPAQLSAGPFMQF